MFGTARNESQGGALVEAVGECLVEGAAGVVDMSLPLYNHKGFALGHT